ncbi:MAG: hypothetical protein ACM31C_23220 [Acidobacteriota bacterium]
MLSTLATIAALPWLQGFEPAAVTDRPTRGVLDELAEWQPAEDRCVAAAYGGLEVIADLTPAPGDERVLASFSQGLVVLDRDRHLISRAPGFTCQGSADELEAMAIGDAWIGEPVIALAATAGGHNESVTSLTLYRVGDAGALVPVFTGEVERHVGRATRTGIVMVFPGGLVYRAPNGTTSVWRYDEAAGRYVDRTVFGPVV